MTLSKEAAGETNTFLQRAQDTGGKLLQLRWSARPGGKVGEYPRYRADVVAAD
jgi:hypothetical protein